MTKSFFWLISPLKLRISRRLKYSQKVTLIKKLDHALVTEVLTHERSNEWGKSIEVVPCNTLLHFWDYGDSQRHHFSSGASPFSKSPLDSCAPELKLCPIALWAPGHHRSLSVKTETDTRMSLRTSLHWMCKKFCKGGWPHRSPNKRTIYMALHMQRMPGIPSWKGSTSETPPSSEFPSLLRISEFTQNFWVFLVYIAYSLSHLEK